MQPYVFCTLATRRFIIEGSKGITDCFVVFSELTGFSFGGRLGLLASELWGILVRVSPHRF